MVKDEQTGQVIELRCVYDPLTKGGDAPDGRKVKATLHWVAEEQAVPCTVRLYDNLFVKENPNEVEEGRAFTDNLNPTSLEELTNCWAEPGLTGAVIGSRYQFERLGYFCVDPDSGDSLVFNRTLALRDPYAKLLQKAR